MVLDLDKYNSELQQAAQDLVRDVKKNAHGMDVRHRANSPSKGSSLAKTRGRTRLEDGAVNRISISFPRQLIYTHKGAGKGRGGEKGSRWVDRWGAQKKTNPDSLGKQGTEGRTAKPFISDALEGENGVERIATIAAEGMGTAIINNLLKL